MTPKFIWYTLKHYSIPNTISCHLCNVMKYIHSKIKYVTISDIYKSKVLQKVYQNIKKVGKVNNV